MLTCRFCQATFSSGPSACPACGKRLPASSAHKSRVAAGSKGQSAQAAEPPMDTELIKRSHLLVGVAIGVGVLAFMCIANSLISHNSGLALTGKCLVFGSLVPWFWGLGCYAKAKGYPPIVAIAGLFSFIGLIVLIMLPTKNRTI